MRQGEQGVGSYVGVVSSTVLVYEFVGDVVEELVDEEGVVVDGATVAGGVSGTNVSSGGGDVGFVSSVPKILTSRSWSAGWSTKSTSPYPVTSPPVVVGKV